MTEVAKLDELRVGGLTLTGITRGGVETCLMVPELSLMFDVGMCPPGALAYPTILVSHGHADHLGGLTYLISQHGLMSSPPPVIHMPEEIVAPMRQILAGWSQIEGFELQFDLHGHAPGTRATVGRNLSALALRTSHRVPSLAWAVERTTHRLRPEYVGREGREIAALRAAGEAITEAHVEPLLCVTGDTKIEFFDEHELARRCKVLVHECTSWDDRRDVEVTRKWGHTHLDELVARAEQFTGEALVLVHRSMRHSRGEAEAIVARRFPAAMRGRVHVFGW
jgi:ribonuclease Z